MSNIFPEENDPYGRFRPFAELLVGLRFLTRLPIPFARTIDPPPLAQSMRFFAVAGGLIGAANGLFLATFHALLLPDQLSAVLTCVVGVLLTGALHEDGLADVADGLFGCKTREQRLLIMHDSRIGTYGAIALLLGLLARISCYQALLHLPTYTMILVVAAAAGFSRAMVVDMMWATRAARSDGLSVLAGRPGRNAALFAIISGGSLTVLAGSMMWPESSIVAIIVAIAVTGLLRRIAMRLIGGQTGDVCGATQVLVEVAMLSVFCATIS
jgi:adenosylcobinamide-GDP ribazoletransferase